MWLGDLFKKRDYPLFVRLPFVLVRVTPNSTSYTGNIPFFSRETCRRASLLYFRMGGGCGGCGRAFSFSPSNSYVP